MQKIVLLYVLLFPLLSWGQHSLQTYDIKNISTLEGLSKNTVNKICVDRTGNVWIGTSYGLNRYDGRNVVTYYHHSNDSNSLQSSNIYDIYEQEDGTLWIVTLNGVCCYDYAADNFHRKNLGSWYRENSKVLEDKNSIWLFGNQNKIFRINKDTQKVENINIDSRYLLKNIRKVVEHDEETFLFITTWEGAFLLDKQTHKVTGFFETTGERFFGLQKTDLGYVMASRSNLYHLSRSGEVLHYDATLYDKLGKPIVLGVMYNKWKNTICLQSDGDGIFIFDSKLNLLQVIKSGDGVNGILPDNAIREILLYDEKTMFVGTVRAGLVILYESQFNEYRHLTGSEYGTITNSINSIAEDEDGLIWLGTDGGGLKSFDMENNSFKSYYQPEVSKITSIVNFTNEYLLVASYLKGLFLFDKKTKEFISSKKHPVLKNIDTRGHIRIFEDSKNNIWIGIGHQVYRVNLENGEISTPLRDANITGHLARPSVFITAFENENHEIWFCSFDGLLCYSLNENKYIDQIDLSGYPNIGGLVFGATEDSEGNIIFGAGEGLYSYNKTSGSVSDYLEELNQINRVYHSVYCNENDEVWCGTTGGLIRIDRSDSTKHVNHFNQLGEIGGSEYRHGAVLESSDGLLYLGSTNGLTVFNPNKIAADNLASKVTISSLTSNGVKKQVIQNKLLALNVEDSVNVQVKYSPVTYNFKFNTYNFLDEEHTQYSYKLENFDKMWNLGDFREASYSNLTPGEYIFKVKATNMNGIMGKKSTKVYLKILPAWYQSLWFKLVVIGIVILIAFVIWRESLKRAKLKSQLAFEKLEQDKLKEINQMKLRFFTNISHELKTPLTLILAPLEHLVRQKSSPEDIKKMSPFLYRNAQRMNMLITQLLEFRKAEMSALEINLQKADLLIDCREAINHFKHQSEIEGIQLRLQSELSDFIFVYDRDKLLKILFNLISNALKHTTKGDEISVEVQNEADKGVTIRVKDSGVGIPQASLNNVFERFYQANNKETGTGIGLAYTKQLVKLHKGTIAVESKEGEYTLFTVFLPWVNETSKYKVQEQKTDARLEFEEQTTVLHNKNESEQKTSVLVVEDEWDLRKYLVDLLQTKYTVWEAKNGDEGIKLALEKIPDLVITDIMMPVLDGYELCKKLKSDLRISHIPLIMLTAKSESASHLKGYKLGADAYVSKPFDTSVLLTQIESVLKNRALLKERFSHDLDLKPEELSPSHSDEVFMQKAVGIIEMNMENPGFGVPQFVEGVGLGRTQVYNKTKALTGKTINEFILHIRMRRAAQLLKQSNKSITEIAISCGFNDQSYFSTSFKKYFSVSPSNYRSSSK